MPGSFASGGAGRAGSGALCALAKRLWLWQSARHPGIWAGLRRQMGCGQLTWFEFGQEGGWGGWVLVLHHMVWDMM